MCEIGLGATIRIHGIDLVIPVPVGHENDLASVGGPMGGDFTGCVVGQPGEPGPIRIIDVCISNRHSGHENGDRPDAATKDRIRLGFRQIFLETQVRSRIRESTLPGHPLARLLFI